MSAGNLRVTPEQLIALNDEIAMLIRAGVPLELGLRERGDSVSGALRHINEELSRQMQSGMPLAASLAATLPGLPRVYSAVIEAGLQSGNLPRALESLSGMARQGIELRQRIEFAFLYPLIVISIAYSLFLFLVIESTSRWSLAVGDFHIAQDPIVQLLMMMGRQWRVWAGIPPLLIAIPLLWWWLRARSTILPDRPPSHMLTLIPGLRSAVTYWQWAGFCDLLATLMEHEVPLPKAIPLAADATGNSEIHRQLAAVSADLQAGRSMADSVRHRQRIPAFLRWSLATAQEPVAFQDVLRHCSELYRTRANFRADAIKMWLSPVLIILFGGGAVSVYAIIWSIPLRTLYMQLNQEGF